MPRFQDIKQFTRTPGYMFHVSLRYLPAHYAHVVGDYGLNVSPDFQRDNVWTESQKIAFMEYMLRGGNGTGTDLYTNNPTWHSGLYGINDKQNWFVLVDGKQRLDAALGFLNNEFKVFGHFYEEYEDRPDNVQCRFRWHVNDLATYEEVLQWYLDLNAAGTPHTDDELDKVRALLAKKETPAYVPPEEIFKLARMDRKIVQYEIEKNRKHEEEIRLRNEARKAEEALKPKRKTKAKTK